MSITLETVITSKVLRSFHLKCTFWWCALGSQFSPSNSNKYESKCTDSRTQTTNKSDEPKVLSSNEFKWVYLLCTNAHGFYGVCVYNLVTMPVHLHLMRTNNQPNDIYQVIFLTKNGLNIREMLPIITNTFSCSTPLAALGRFTQNLWLQICHFSWNFFFPFRLFFFDEDVNIGVSTFFSVFLKTKFTLKNFSSFRWSLQFSSLHFSLWYVKSILCESKLNLWLQWNNSPQFCWFFFQIRF